MIHIHIVSMRMPIQIGLSEFDIDLRHMKAPIGLPPLQPHIIGKAVKS